MTLFSLYFKRDIKQVLLNPRLMILPLGFFCLSLFLIHFTAINMHYTTDSPALYWVLFILSTTGALGQNIARDHDTYFLQAIQSEGTSLRPYIFAKTLSLLLAWSIPFGLLMIGIHFFDGRLTLFLVIQSIVIVGALSGVLSFLYCLFDSLFLHGQRSPFLGLILLVPFILPLLILSLLSLEESHINALIPVISYAIFLSCGAYLLTHKALK